jgi:Holliday junction resolvase-like predicted endonuclease
MVKKNRGRTQRRRGRRAEYKVRDLFRSLGWKADRVPISGAGSIKGDVIARKGAIKVVVEVKRQKYLPRLIWHDASRWKQGGSDLVKTKDGKFYLVADAYLWIKDLTKVRETARYLAEANAPTVITDKLPASLRKMLQQAERENAVLFIVPERARHYIVIERVMV